MAVSLVKLENFLCKYGIRTLNDLIEMLNRGFSQKDIAARLNINEAQLCQYIQAFLHKHWYLDDEAERYIHHREAIERERIVANSNARKIHVLPQRVFQDADKRA